MHAVNTRKRFGRGRPGWESYVAFSGLDQLEEVVSVDMALNPSVDGRGDIICFSIEEIADALGELPTSGADAFRLVAVEIDGDPPAVDGFTHVGCDLADGAPGTSSLLNCGPWRGLLAPFVARTNGLGLLRAADAHHARTLLPIAWGEQEHHAQVQVYALYVDVDLPGSRAAHG